MHTWKIRRVLVLEYNTIPYISLRKKEKEIDYIARLLLYTVLVYTPILPERIYPKEKKEEPH